MDGINQAPSNVLETQLLLVVLKNTAEMALSRNESLIERDLNHEI